MNQIIFQGEQTKVFNKKMIKAKPPLKRNMTLAIISLEETDNPSKREFRLVASPIALKTTSPRSEHK